MKIEQLQILVETVQELSLARDINKIMNVVRTAARKLTGADGATFILRDNDRCFYADEDAIGPLWKGQRFPMKACISGWAMLHKETVIIPDIYEDERIPIEAYRPTFVKSLVMVPIRTKDPIGAIGNYWASEHAATPVEIELLQSLADITSVSVENVYAYEDLRAQNNKLMEIASMQSHQVRSPIANIQGLINLFNVDNPSDPMNAQIITRLRSAADVFDKVIREIVQSTNEIDSRSGSGDRTGIFSTLESSVSDQNPVS
jgi:GAF domain-containing protein